MDCLFCKIVQGELPTDFIYEDDQVVAFRDINPQAPFHALIIPRQHIATLNDLTPAEEQLVGHLLLTASTLAKENGFAAEGYRTVFNCNQQGGQTVYHIHLHVLGGKPLGWPPYQESLKH